MTGSDALSFAKDIRPMFTEVDVAHMKNLGLDLSSFDEVKKNGDPIYKLVSDGSMPPEGTGERWTTGMCATFKRWQEQGCPP
jgi:hypothetical protein